MIYFDNAATTPVDPEVQQVMNTVLKEYFGNPSSTHEPGRKSRVIIEDARQEIAGLLQVKPSEIFFTSCGTEALNMALWGCFHDLGVKHFITSSMEHHAVTHTLEVIKLRGNIEVHNVQLLPGGDIDLGNLEDLIRSKEKPLVCLMHANNEIRNLLPLDTVSRMCREHGAYFLTDTVQTMGKYCLDFSDVPVDFATCSAHKFHGPKGVGFLYIRKGVFISPLLTGGGQEMQMRSGTENTQGIAGLAKAMQVAHRDMEKNRQHITQLKECMASALKENFPGITFNGSSETSGLYNLLNVSFPASLPLDVILQKLDMKGIYASGGSACTSGAVSESAVLKAIGCDMEMPALRFSFSKFNTTGEIDRCITELKEIFNPDINGTSI